MISVADALARIVAPLQPVAAETVALSEGWNRVLARPIEARLTQPPADLSAMDGYALRAEDGRAGTRLRVIGSAPAGHPYEGEVRQGQAIRLYTGSVMPPGADCVVIQEDVTAEGDRIVLCAEAVLGRHIRRRGQDFAAGDILLSPGRRLSARDIGLAAAANHPWLTVHRRPRIALLATGDEITLPGEALAAGGIVSSNTHALAALVRAGGGEPVLLPLVGDESAAIAGVADQIGGCDMLVTTGGASVGDRDLVQSALLSRGLTLDFWKVAMRPGKPLIHGDLNGVPMLGLPGNPVSALVCATLFLLPALTALAGETPSPRPWLQARLTVALRANDARADYLRGRLQASPEGGWTAAPFTDQASSLLRVLAEADALILRPPGAPAAPAGTWVEVMPLTPFGI